MKRFKAETKVIKKRIRPSLKTVAPKSAYDVQLFGILDIGLAANLYFFAPRVKSFHLIGVLPLKTWGIIFFGLGLIFLYNLARNHWQAMKNALLLGCIIKCAFGLELFSMSLTNDRPLVILLLLLAFGLMGLQAGTYIYFTPKVKVSTDVGPKQ